MTITYPDHLHEMPLGTSTLKALAAMGNETIARGDACPACGAKWVDHTLTHEEGCLHELCLDIIAERGED